jgi:N-acetylmuramoyl-L-alanine amidase
MVKRLLITIILLLTTNLFADLQVQIGNKKSISIETVYFGETPYYSANFLAEKYNIRIYNRKATGKFVFYFPKKKIKVTANSSFIMIDQDMIHMTSPAIQAGDNIYVPVHSFNNILYKYIYPNLRYTLVNDDEKLIFAVPTGDGNNEKHMVTYQIPEGQTVITRIDYQENINGMAIIFSTNGIFDDTDFSRFFNENNDFYFTVFGCKTDSTQFSEKNPTKSIGDTKVIASDKSTQFIFRLKKEFNSSDVAFNPKSKQIILSLFLPMNEEIKEKIANAKATWKIDTIVLDAGHGGKDPGTVGRWGNLHEKDIVLDVVLRLGRLLEKQKDINVVYTRKTDTFIPLWKRTQIANDSNGKLFLSFHVNAAGSKNAHGFESYLLRPGKEKESIELAKAENAVIQMESTEDKKKYENYDNISNIVANLVSSTYMKDSEDFAEILSNSFSKNVDQKNRGVKQAGFYVLVGASMPKVLIELGYNTNWSEAKKLNSRRHRQHLAQTIFNSIMEFKIKSDNTIQ